MNSDTAAPISRVGKSAAVLVFCLGLFVALWAGSWAAPTGDDSRKYEVLAHNVISGRGLSAATSPPFEPSAARAPVYPLFLALVHVVAGSLPGPVLVTQACLLAFAWVLLADTAGMLFGRRVGLVAGLFAALNPYLARTAGGILTEALFMALIVAAVWMLVRGLITSRTGWYAAAGAMWAVATLCRPATLVVLPLMLAAIALFVPVVRSRLRMAGVLLACAIVGIAPWSIRNYIQFDAFIPLQTHAFGVNFWLTTLDPVDQPVVTWTGKQDEFRRRFPEFDAYYVARGPVEERDSERRLIRAGVARILTHPMRYLGERLRTLPRMWIHSGRLWYSGVSFSDAGAAGRYDIVAIKVLLTFLLSIAPLGLAGAGLWMSRRRWREILPLLILPASIIAVQLPTWVEERYGMPAVPFLLIFAAVAVTARWPGRPDAEGRP